LLRGPETARVREYYERAGFAVDEQVKMEPDHVSIELEFLGHLAEREAEARERADHSRVSDLLHYQDDFLRRHLGRWAFDFLERVARRDASGFYRETGRLTGALLRDLQQAFPELLAEAERT
jgi:TorA maturation chaperone TorD